jgi:hypothetical protein
MKEAEADPHVVQQLMFNRLLSFVRLLWVDGVTIAGFDAEAGTVACSLAGVSFVVGVNLREVEPPPADHR